MELLPFWKHSSGRSVSPANNCGRRAVNFKSVTAAVVLATAAVSPAFAMGPHARSEAVQRRQQEARAYQYYRNDRLWPADMAAGVVRGAVGTAGAIAAEPFGYDPYHDYYGRRYGW